MSTIKRSALLIALLIVTLSAAPAYAQFDTSLSSDDMTSFFSWFSTMFGSLLPIGLLGVSVIAGALFVMIIFNLFRRFLGKRRTSRELSPDQMAELEDPLNPHGLTYEQYIRQQSAIPLARKEWDEYYDRLSSIREMETLAPDKKRKTIDGYGEKERIGRLTAWEFNYLIGTKNKRYGRLRGDELRQFRRDVRESRTTFFSVPTMERGKKGKGKNPVKLDAPLFGASDLNPTSRRGKRGRRGDDNILGMPSFASNGSRRRGRGDDSLFGPPSFAPFGGGSRRRGRGDDLFFGSSLMPSFGGGGRRSRRDDFGPPSFTPFGPFGFGSQPRRRSRRRRR